MDEVTTLSGISVSVTVLSQMFLYLSFLEVDIDEFLRSLGVDPAIVKTPDARMPLETYLLIQDEAARFTNDPYFGLHMGEFAETIALLSVQSVSSQIIMLPNRLRSIK